MTDLFSCVTSGKSPLCQRRWRGASRDGGIVSVKKVSVTIPQSASLTASFTQGSLIGGTIKISTISFGTCDFEVRTKPRVGRRLPQAGGTDGHRRQILSALSILNDCRRCPHACGKPRAPTRGAKSVQSAKNEQTPEMPPFDISGVCCHVLFFLTFRTVPPKNTPDLQYH